MAEDRDRKDVLLEAGLTLASELSLPIVLQRIVDLAAQVTDARYGALGVIGEGDVLTEFVTTGIDARRRRAIGNPPTGRGVLGLLIHDPRPVRIKNIGDHPQSVGFPPNHPAMRSFLGAPVQALGRVFGNIYLAEKRSADEFSRDDEEALVVLATQAGVAIANATLYQELRSRERWLDALRDITTQVLAGNRESVLLASIADHARELAEADSATVMVRSATAGELVVAAASGSRSDDLLGQRVPENGSISGAVMRNGESLVFDDLTSESGAYQPVVRLGRHGPAFFVPLRVPGGATGTLMVANLKGGQRFQQTTRELVNSLADAASVAVEYDRAQSELRRLGLMDERERIAKELHDGIIQSLFAVGMGLQGTALMASEPETARRIENAVEELDRVIRDLRNYIFGLRPGILADRQLDQALRDLGKDMESRTPGSVEVEVDAATAAMLSSRSAELVQVTREALSNVARHAQANRTTVRLERQGRQAVLTVSDDGVGFEPNGPAAGNGMRNMRERAAGLGGKLEVTSSSGNGTTLKLAFPIEGR
ncbi:MAG TPA: GAF domain-containing sensor histidine kinase [Candidatus Dormibacteraeota bacterium]|nr:GAF domain-containing sensor histidine kinase [Candidatus Dormibacteraeota bacterium]